MQPPAAGDWSAWTPHPSGDAYTVGVEEEVMLLHPQDWSLAQLIDTVMSRLDPGFLRHVTAETHRSALELATGVHSTVGGAIEELRGLRDKLEGELSMIGLAAASAGTHPFAVWQQTVVSSGERYQEVYGSMRELARREPTFGLHVHIGVRDAEDAVQLANRLRGHLPLFLAMSANSPFWQGRDTGLASARTPLFQAFPRVGIPRAFADYGDYVNAVDLLIRCDAFPEPTFLWWDVRLQPRFGTVEVRIMDSQWTIEDTAALVALVQATAALEIEEPYLPPAQLSSPEVLDENRFLAARDGASAELIDVQREVRVPVTEQLDRLLAACAPHAHKLGCAQELELIRWLCENPGAQRQLATARAAPDRLPGLVRELSAAFCQEPGARAPATAAGAAAPVPGSPH